MKYEDYASKTCKDLHPIQEAFKEQYDIDSYENWFYTQASEILRLYSDGKEVYFKYIPVGTFSRNSNSWMWAWANEDSIEARKLHTLKVKDFGQEKGYPNLINHHFEGDEYTGWELTSITLKILGGIGTYRVVSDHLEKYFLITEEISKEEAEKIENDLIDCNIHGKSRPAFICQHLNTDSKTGFEEAFETYRGMELGEDDDLSAWCNECEKERLKTDGWNDDSMEFAKIKLVCEGCYFSIKEFNEEIN
jgi:hypothetical protein